MENKINQKAGHRLYKSGDSFEGPGILFSGSIAYVTEIITLLCSTLFDTYPNTTKEIEHTHRQTKISKWLLLFGLPSSNWTLINTGIEF